MSTPTFTASLAGHFTLRPGQHDSISGVRPVVVADRLSLMLQGQACAQAQRTLSHLFALCGHAHQRACALAFAAAVGADAAQTAPSLSLLRWETARDHLRAMALEWPSRLPLPTPQSHQVWDGLESCPLPLAGRSPEDADAAWLSLERLHHWLAPLISQMPLSQWLHSHRDPDALAQWCLERTSDTVVEAQLFPADFLAYWHPFTHTQQAELRALNVLDHDAGKQRQGLEALAHQLSTQAGFSQRPTWRGACAETGTWTRLRHRHEQDSLPHTVWTRLSARWLELLDIAASDPLSDNARHDPLLSSGSLSLGQGQAIAWCEMARGLLLHWVQIDAQAKVKNYRVLAPTEWNSHPEGAMAACLSAMSANDALAAHTLAAAYDPCVACTVMTPSSVEVMHA
jgi:hypothetical protein